MDYKPEHLEKITYELHEAQKAYDLSVIEFDRLNDIKDDFLDSLINELDNGVMTEMKLKRLARGTEKWKAFKTGLQAAKDKKIELSTELKNKRNHYNTVERGMSYRRDEMKWRVG